MSCRALVAVDIGNSRIKLGWYDQPLANAFTEPLRTLQLTVEPWDPGPLAAWLGHAKDPATPPPDWCSASVNSSAAARLTDWLLGVDPLARPGQLRYDDLPLTIALAAPERVGIDRLLAAVAVNHLRVSARPAIVVDLGSAITVDVISHQGAFLGGAILPGIGMAARALAEQTDQLPHLGIERLTDPPPSLGISTEAAIESGLFWGAIGGIRELVARLSDDLPVAPQLFLTGGAAATVAQLLDPEACYVAELVLGGIALVRALQEP